VALREILARFGFEIDSKQLSAASQGVGFLSKTISALPNIAGGIAGALGLGVVKDQVDELAAEAIDLGKAATKSAVGFQAFQRIQYQTGLGAEQLSGLFRKLQQNIAGARGEADQAGSDFADADGGIGKALGKKQAAETFGALGVEINDASGTARSSAEVFQDTALALSKVTDPAQRTALAIRLFGRSGADLLPFLEKSPEAIAELGDQFDAVGGFSDEARAKFTDYNKANKLLKLETKALKIAFVSELAPALTFIVKKIGEVGTWFKKNADTSNLLKIALGLLVGGFLLAGNTAVGAAVKSALAWARAALPVIVLAIILDDLVHFLEGDANTAIEKLFKALLPADQAAEDIDFLRNAFAQWKSEITSSTSKLYILWHTIEGIGNAMQRLGAVIAGGLLGKKPEEVLADFAKAKAEAQKNGGAAAPIAFKTSDIEKNVPKGGLSLSSLFNPAELFKLSLPAGGANPKDAGAKTVQQTNHISIKVDATGEGADVGEAVGDGVKGALGDERRAALAHLEGRK
jgi:hypothetical protein